MKELKGKFFRLTAGDFFLEDNLNNLEKYLMRQGWLVVGDRLLGIEIPGQGNMNLTLRVVPQLAAPFILKQARPWVEKYPQLQAPVERIHVEHRFYQHINKHSNLEQYSPHLLGFDSVNSLLAMEHFQEAADFSFLYQPHMSLNPSDMEAAIRYLNYLKQIPQPSDFPSNLALRKLNHQHIFVLPFSDNLFALDDIQPGLRQLALKCKKDQYLVDRINQLGESYLGAGPFLLHGDYYPGSFLKTGQEFKVIDPEFSFLGPEEWDIGVFTAHMFLTGTPKSLINRAFRLYHKSKHFSEHDFSGFAGVEILRRLLGLAQVPVTFTLEQKSHLIELAIHWIKNGKIDTLSSYEKHLAYC
jgi:5-methylthioribose kinase